VTVIINGGRIAPGITRPYSVPYRFGVTVGSALASTGVIAFGPNGQITSISGIYVGPGSSINYTLRVNGRLIPPNQLFLPLQPQDAVEVALF